MSASHPTKLKVLAITSGKGGVGKTTLSLNIARQLSLHGICTLLVDLDIHNKGATGLFLEKVPDSASSTIKLVDESERFKSSLAVPLANRASLVQLDREGRLLFLPASGPRDLINWSRLVEDPELIGEFLRTFLESLAGRLSIGVVVMDCYGGVDTLTVAAAGMADNTIIVNEPDIVTFSGTLMLYNYLACVYKERARKPNVSFVINRVTSRHSFQFLEGEYRKHLSPLAVGRSMLAYFPYDKFLMETFGDYPFFTEVLPGSLVTQKILLLIGKLWGEPPFSGLLRASERRRRWIHRSTREASFADPERILRISVTAPVWLAIPIGLLLLLNSGTGRALEYNTIRAALIVSVALIAFIIVAVVIFEPFQITRWLIRSAKYVRRKRMLSGRFSRLGNLLRSVLQYGLAFIPAAFSVAVSLYILKELPTFGEIWSYRRDVSIWRGKITGFRAGRHYEGLKLASGASIPAGSDLSGAFLEKADLAGTTLDGVRFISAHLDGADLRRATMRGADLTDAKLNRANLSMAKLDRAILRNVDLTALRWQDEWLYDRQAQRFTRLDFEETPLPPSRSRAMTAEMPGSDLQGAILRGQNWQGARMSGAKLIRSDLQETNLSAADLVGAELRGANLARSNLAAPTCPGLTSRTPI